MWPSWVFRPSAEEGAAQAGCHQDQGHVEAQQEAFPEPADELLFLHLPPPGFQVSGKIRIAGAAPHTPPYFLFVPPKRK
jgi:hypothetical protein